MLHYCKITQLLFSCVVTASRYKGFIDCSPDVHEHSSCGFNSLCSSLKYLYCLDPGYAGLSKQNNFHDDKLTQGYLYGIQSKYSINSNKMTIKEKVINAGAGNLYQPP